MDVLSLVCFVYTGKLGIRTKPRTQAIVCQHKAMWTPDSSMSSWSSSSSKESSSHLIVSEHDLVAAASEGRLVDVRTLLSRPLASRPLASRPLASRPLASSKLPKANCLDGLALIEAAKGGHREVVKLLLDWPEDAPKANCQDSRAVFEAAEGGHTEVVSLLLRWHQDAPRVTWDERWESACSRAARNGHEAIVNLIRMNQRLPTLMKMTSHRDFVAELVATRHIARSTHNKCFIE